MGRQPQGTPTTPQLLRIVVASPRDVQAERNAVSAVAEELNRGIAADHNLRLEVCRWETDAYPGFHVDGPQGLIDTILRIEDSDLLIGIFWKRFGSPVKDAGSGTEHEIKLAYEAWKRDGRPQIMVYFNEKAYTPRWSQETDQWGKVLKFKEEFPKDGLWWSYKGKTSFERLLRNHLTQFIRREYPQPATARAIPPAVSALHQLPAPPCDFTGRKKERTELLKAARKGGAIISGVGLHGMAGVGKSALALVLANQLKQQYPDAQFFLDLKGVSQEPLTAADAMAHVVQGFLPEAKRPENEAELAGLYRSLLDGKKALLLMDNARDAAQVEPLLPPEGCALLVTSRQHFTLPGLQAKDLDALPLPDACKLLLKIARRIDNAADEVARLCGCLPLALRVTASAIAEHTELSVEDYVRRLTDTKQRLKLTGVEASLALSYELLKPEEQTLWRALAVFPGDFDVAGAAAVWALNADLGQDALSDLRGFSLVEWNEASRRYRLHDLARDFAGSRLTGDERADAEARHAAHYAAVLRTARGLYEQGGEGVLRGLALFDVERANIEAGQAWAAVTCGTAAPGCATADASTAEGGRATQSEMAARLANDYPDAGAYFLELRLHPREKVRWLEAALRAARRLKSMEAEGRHLGNLGLAYADLGEVQRAIGLYEERLKIAREIGDRRGEGRVLGNLGIAYCVLGDPRSAIEMFEQDLKIAREIGDRRGEGDALGNLGLAYADLGDPREAIELHEQRLRIAREIGDRHGEESTLGNLGLAYAALGEPRKAIESYEQQLKIAREIGDRRGEGNALGSLGTAYVALGEPRKAMGFQEMRLAIAREIGDRRGEENAFGNLGLAYAALGERRKAIERYGVALQIARDIGDRRGEALANWNQGVAYEEEGNLQLAIELMQVRVDYERQLGHADAEKHAAQVEELRKKLTR